MNLSTNIVFLLRFCLILIENIEKMTKYDTTTA